MKKTVFTFLSLSAALSIMGYAADGSLIQEDVAAQQNMTSNTTEGGHEFLSDLASLQALDLSSLPQITHVDLGDAPVSGDGATNAVNPAVAGGGGGAE